MQNKGFVKVFAVLLTLVCVFYLSFSFVTRHYTNKAKEFAKGDVKVEQDYLDSLSNEKVWLGNYTLKQCREMEISLGLDLKGGMNVILEVSVPDVIKALADNKPDEAFNKALAEAAKQATTSQDDVITLFIKEYHKTAPGAKLSELFATQQLKDKVNQKSSDAEVEKVLREEVKAAVTNSYNVLRTRIDRFGVVQPNIQSLEDKMGRIMVELPGIKEPERVRKLLQGSANLEFWETYNAKEVAPYLQAADSKLRAVLAHETTANDTVAAVDSTALAATEATPDKAVSAADSLAAALKGGEKKQQASSADLEQLKKEHPLLAILSVNPNGGPVVGYANYKDTATVNSYLAMKEIAAELPKDLRLKWGVSPFEYDPKGQTFELYAIKSTERNGKAPLEGDVVTDAKDDYDQYGKPSVSMSMNSDGARRWALLTKQNINKSIAIVLDNYVYSAPNVSNEITGGNSQITGHFTPEQAKDLANVLKSGKMPAPAHIVQEDIVGPSLGQESINAGIFSFVVALILLMIYMCSMYGFIPGMIANGALVLNFFFTLGILSSFQAALTMSGIAGMVLSLGMAVDANVLIYERTKEELRSGKGVKKALADGYSNAFSAIFDSNLTSIITGIILFYFGTGPIRGFATTLIIGILCSFFTAVFMTRLVYEHFMNKDKLLNLTFTSPISKKMLVNTHFDFMGGNKKWLTITGVILLICIGSLVTRGLSQSIDFTGGRNFKVQFENPIEPEQVRELISNKFGDANVSVISIGTDKKTVRISTNYRIQDEGNNVDSEIESYLYEALKPMLTQNITLATFIDRDNHTGGSIISSQKVGPSIADDIKTAAIWSVVFALIAIGLYILLRFRNIAYSVGSVAALTSDTLMIMGAYSLCWGWMPFSLEIDQTFIGAILTAIGYSINDKVVIFDRVREFFSLYPKRNVKQLFDDSLNTTLARTINTSLSTLIVLLCIFILGGDSIRSFAFAMILGVVIGTLSSLFVASPIAYMMLKNKKGSAPATTTEE
ncbi:protein translocase subunit SecDF [Bacteroides hominis (ex Liu et al. 2022)]|jgi:SecD/SecF fusion protein|uniref:protein translocase subunit SecDF n=1 Tax=Bacteroides TaxID=816 RepID=UPI0004D99697|nr:MULTISPECIES: protein translocase subunit SecDF [Bacteroides]MBY2903727.1 preprotein translocase subunit SecD [Bacteroides fragilis]MCE8575714.1 protein translocase subunit SecDF [Bacteroides fragilis]MCE8613070.1 protein translocase subunit SecDF [Bacteroides fragilis]MCM0277185.1 protein translocase subunit SecDF [Bacteroides fragilis]MDV6144117.1 protein translocase subunit SecDF [Bacteroides hominis (ex Liu et al. 2022)]